MTQHDETPETVQQHLAAHISYARLSDLAAGLERDRNRLHGLLSRYGVYAPATAQDEINAALSGK